MYIQRILSNNAVIAETDGGEVVALGPGIGYRHKRGQELTVAEVERVFRPSPAEPIERLSAFLAELPPPHLDAALEICQLAAAQLSISLGQAAVIAIPTISVSRSGGSRRTCRSSIRSPGRSPSCTPSTRLSAAGR